MREILIQNAQLLNEGMVSQKDLLIRGEKIERISNLILPVSYTHLTLPTIFRV